MSHKLLTSKRLLVIDRKALSSSLKRYKSRKDFYEIAPKFNKVSVFATIFERRLIKLLLFSKNAPIRMRFVSSAILII